jgi:hypothetical protein
LPYATLAFVQRDGEPESFAELKGRLPRQLGTVDEHRGAAGRPGDVSRVDARMRLAAAHGGRDLATRRCAPCSTTPLARTGAPATHWDPTSTTAP